MSETRTGMLVRAAIAAVSLVGGTVTAPTVAGATPALVVVQAASPVGPTVAAKATPNPVGVGSLVTLGETIKAGVGPFSYGWIVVSAPGGSAAALSSPSVANPTFTPDVAGSYQFSLTVTDSLGRSSTPTLVAVQTAPT